MHEALTRIEWAARRVIGPALENGRTDESTLGQLHASVVRQVGAARDLRLKLIADGSDPCLQSQVTELLSYLEDMNAKLEVRLGLWPEGRSLVYPHRADRDLSRPAPGAI